MFRSLLFLLSLSLVVPSTQALPELASVQWARENSQLLSQGARALSTDFSKGITIAGDNLVKFGQKGLQLGQSIPQTAYGMIKRSINPRMVGILGLLVSFVGLPDYAVHVQDTLDNHYYFSQGGLLNYLQLLKGNPQALDDSQLKWTINEVLKLNISNATKYHLLQFLNKKDLSIQVDLKKFEEAVSQVIKQLERQKFLEKCAHSGKQFLKIAAPLTIPALTIYSMYCGDTF